MATSTTFDYCATSGIQVWTIGIGPEGRKVANELRYLATMPRYALSGDMASLVQKAAFTMVSGGLLKSKFILMTDETFMQNLCKNSEFFRSTIPNPMRNLAIKQMDSSFLLAFRGQDNV